MRYFLSLGMNRPPPQMSSSVPNSSSFMESALDASRLSKISAINIPSEVGAKKVITTNINARQRTKTVPSPKKSPDDFNLRTEEKRRTTSIPIPISEAFAAAANNLPRHQQISYSLGTYLNSSIIEDDEEDEENEYNQYLIEGRDEDEEFENESMNTSLNMSSGSLRIDESERTGNGESNSPIFETEPVFGEQSDSPVRFIPPHELMANSKKDFNVGTAHSVAVWEQRRRKFI